MAQKPDGAFVQKGLVTLTFHMCCSSHPHGNAGTMMVFQSMHACTSSSFALQQDYCLTNNFEVTGTKECLVVALQR